ncbi:MAG: hypothetical protein ACK561_03390 [Pseudomonadaceae bacterium]
MHSAVGIGAALALATLAGCVSKGTVNQQPVIVDYYAGTTEGSGYSFAAGLGGGNFFIGDAGTQRSFVSQPFDVRKCNAEMSACALGIVDLTTSLAIRSVSQDGVIVEVAAAYQVSAQSSRDGESWQLNKQLMLPEIINDSGTVTRLSKILYGEARKVELPYGVIFSFCVSPPGTSSMDVRPCSSRLQVRHSSDLQAF